MLFKVPEVFDYSTYYRGISLVLWIITISGCFIGALLFIIKANKMELKSQKWLYLGYGVFFIFFSLMRIFYIVAVYIPENYDLYTSLGYVVGTIGLIFWLYVLETQMIKSTKGIFVAISIVMFAVAVIGLTGIIERELALNIINITTPFSISVVFFMYMYIAVKGTGEVRKKAIWLIVGLLLIMLGHAMDSEFWAGNFPDFPYEIPPIVMLIGLLIFLITQLL
ncbi:MAG: hypothetical protein ACP6IY_06595 [Promethearchaeia archaeon]